jgi:hypothetical protein
MVPVPPKGFIYPDMLWDKAVKKDSVPRLDFAHQTFSVELSRYGIQVLDLTGDLIRHRFDAQGTTYCKQDTHWSGRATVIAARSIAAQIADREWLKARPKRSFQQQWKRVRIAGDLWPGAQSEVVQETLPLRFVGTAAKAKTTIPSTQAANAALQAVAIDRNSPVLLLGDSHTLVFHEGGDMHAKGAGLPDQLALELGFPVDLIGVRGSGATPARTTFMRRVRANPNYLKGKKLVIWCFSAREFTESSGWQKVPVVPGSVNVPADELQRNKGVWAQTKMANYSYTLKMQCYCDLDFTQPLRVTVRNGQPSAIHSVRTGEPLKMEQFEKYNSIDRIFRLIEREMQEEHTGVRVTYDRTTGHPTEFVTGPLDPGGITDTGFSLTVEDIQATP